MVSGQAIHLKSNALRTHYFCGWEQWIFWTKEQGLFQVGQPVGDDLLNVVADREEPSRE